MPRGDKDGRKEELSGTISDEFGEAVKGEVPKRERDPAKEYKNASRQGAPLSVKETEK